MAKEKDLIFQKALLTKLSLDSLLKFKAIVRFLIIFVYGYLATYLLFNFQDTFSISKSAANKALYKVILVAINIYIAQIALKRNAMAMNGKIFNFGMNLCLFGYATFLAIHFSHEDIHTFRDMYQLVYYVYPVLAFHALWYWGCAFLDRRTRPFLSKVLLLKSFTHISMMIMMLLAHFYIHNFTNLMNHTGKSLNFKSHEQIGYAFGWIFMSLTSIVVFIWRSIYYREKIKINDASKTLVLSVVFIILIPLTIWYVAKIGSWPTNIYEWVAMIVPIGSVLMLLIYTLMRKTYLSSGKIFVTILSIAIVLTWTSKIWVEQQWPFDVHANVSTQITLLAVSAMVLMAFVKNVNMSKMLSMGYLGVAFSIIIVVIYNWLINSYPAIYDLIVQLGVEVDDIFNTLILTDCLIMVMASIISWYRVQKSINANHKRKIKSAKAIELKGVQ